MREATQVSILVLMDLAHEYNLKNWGNWVIFSFNPCFNGSCSRIHGLASSYSLNYSSFNPCFNGSCSRISNLIIIHVQKTCFNPCFNGSCSRIDPKSILVMLQLCFNPCFNGSCSRMWKTQVLSKHCHLVSILVLMDLAHESCPQTYKTRLQ